MTRRRGPARLRAIIAAIALVAPWCPTTAETAGVATADPPGVRPAAVAADPVAPPDTTEQRANCAVTVPADPTAEPAGHRLLDVTAAHRFSRGAGVTVAVIDTGVSPHPRLPRLRAGGDYVGTGDGLADCDAHGTVVAGIIAGQASATDSFVGVAPDASIISIRQSSGAYSAKTRGRDTAPVVGAGYGPVETLARAVVRAVDLGAQVINISEVACAPTVGALDDSLLGAALAHARSRDAVVVVAAGNIAGSTACREQNPAGAPSRQTAWRQVKTVVTPARFAPQVLTVGAVTAADGTPADFTINGPWVSVAAPGTDVVSLAPGVGGARLIGALRTPDGPAPLAGTSYAAPYVSGLAALIRSRYPSLNAEQVMARIVRTAHGGGWDAASGAGLIDPAAALSADLTDAPPTPRPATFTPTTPQDDPGSGVGVVAAALAVGVVAVLAARGVSARYGRGGARGAARR